MWCYEEGTPVPETDSMFRVASGVQRITRGHMVKFLWTIAVPLVYMYGGALRYPLVALWCVFLSHLQCDHAQPGRKTNQLLRVLGPGSGRESRSRPPGQRTRLDVL